MVTAVLFKARVLLTAIFPTEEPEPLKRAFEPVEKVNLLLTAVLEVVQLQKVQPFDTVVAEFPMEPPVAKASVGVPEAPPPPTVVAPE